MANVLLSPQPKAMSYNRLFEIFPESREGEPEPSPPDRSFFKKPAESILFLNNNVTKCFLFPQGGTCKRIFDTQVNTNFTNKDSVLRDDPDLKCLVVSPCVYFCV